MRNRLKVHIPKVAFRRFSEKSKADQAIGQAPGTLIYTGKRIVDKVVLEIYSYNEEEIQHKKSLNWQEVLSESKEERVNWINVSGLSNEAIIDEVGKSYNLNTLLLEDILAVDQRPKAEDFGENIFFTIKMFHDRTSNGIEFEHVSFVLGPNFVISSTSRSRILLFRAL